MICGVKLQTAARYAGVLALTIGLSGCATTRVDDWCAETKYTKVTTNWCLDDRFFRVRYRM